MTVRITACVTGPRQRSATRTGCGGWLIVSVSNSSSAPSTDTSAVMAACSSASRTRAPSMLALPSEIRADSKAAGSANSTRSVIVSAPAPRRS